MTALLLIPVLLSLLVMGAHFLRSGAVVPLAGVFVLVGLLAVRRRWAPRVIQIALALGAVEWVRTLAHLAAARSQSGQPAGRMAGILAFVALFTASSALIFFIPRVRRWYAPEKKPGEEAPVHT